MIVIDDLAANTDACDYASDALQQLDLAALADDPGEKKRHLDHAAHFATLDERTRAPHRLPGEQTEDNEIVGQ